MHDDSMTTAAERPRTTRFPRLHKRAGALLLAGGLLGTGLVVATPGTANASTLWMCGHRIETKFEAPHFVEVTYVDGLNDNMWIAGFTRLPDNSWMYYEEPAWASIWVGRDWAMSWSYIEIRGADGCITSLT
jgi:hypothetical protein